MLPNLAGTILAVIVILCLFICSAFIFFVVLVSFFVVFFFFQAEDGIRDRNVTGVQTCALPISAGEEIRETGLFTGETERTYPRSEEHTSELQSRFDLVCRLLLEKKKKKKN